MSYINKCIMVNFVVCLSLTARKQYPVFKRYRQFAMIGLFTGGQIFIVLVSISPLVMNLL
nr:MAG TPA: hypothetical protein [Caudoviricetes sp.]